MATIQRGQDPKQPCPKSFYEAVSVLNGKQSRKIANNTYLERISPVEIVPGVTLGDTINVRLHGTNVVTFVREENEREVTILRSGGYQTNTTKDRLNRYLPHGVGITQRAGVWKLLKRFDTDAVTEWRVMADFSDGMRIDSLSGEVLG